MSRSAKILWLPFVPFFAVVAYAIMNMMRLPILRVVAGDITVTFCLFIMGIFENCIQIGLIRSNTNYEDLFFYSGLAALILTGLTLLLLAASMKPMTRCKRCVFVLMPMLLSVLFLILLTTWSYALKHRQEPDRLALLAARLPAAAYFAFLLLCGALALSLLYKERQYSKGSITRASIKESVDNLPAGLCFSTDTGMVLLANKAMERLCHRLTSSDLQDAEAFWHTLTAGELGGGAQRLPSDDSPVLRLAGAQAWTFSRRVITVEGRAVTQITAVDITDLDALHLRLQQDNAALLELGRQLRRYIQDVTEVKAREERLATKMRIHDEIGYALLATRHMLERHKRGATSKIAELLALWKRNIAALHGVAKAEKPAALTSLHDVARALGVGLRLEGGGLSDLRRKVEGMGGTMRISHSPHFALTITVPKEGGE